jgi:hypothetical protein
MPCPDTQCAVALIRPGALYQITLLCAHVVSKAVSAVMTVATRPERGDDVGRLR